MLRIELQTPESLSHEKYIQMHMDSFGKYTQHNPVQVYLGFDEDKEIGFVAVNPITDTTLMLHFIGFTKDVMENCLREQKVQYFIEAYEIFKSMGFKYITGMVEGKNTKALIWALKAGFKILGLRARGTDVLLEVIKEV